MIAAAELVEAKAAELVEAKAAHPSVSTFDRLRLRLPVWLPKMLIEERRI